MDLSIIYVIYKSKDKALKSIRAVYDSDLEGINYEIIVVDNASNDGSLEAIKEAYPGISAVKSEKNLGMGAGNNLGIAKSQGEYVLVLNADTYVNRDTIKALWNYMKRHEDAGIIGPKLYYPDGQLQITCYRFPKPYTFLLRRTFLGKYFKRLLDDFLMADYDRQEAREADWIMGSCLLIRKSLFEKIGGAFDDRFWMYFEDTDLCRRTWKAGYKVVFEPRVSAIHDHGRGSAQNPWYTALFKDKLARAHIISWFKYLIKWKS